MEEMTEMGEDWEMRYAPGTAGCHELLDRLSMLTEMLERYLVEHPACVARPEWHALAESPTRRCRPASGRQKIPLD